MWIGGRVVEGARLESVFRGNSNGGSNPLLSAIKYKEPFGLFFLLESITYKSSNLKFKKHIKIQPARTSKIKILYFLITCKSLNPLELPTFPPKKRTNFFIKVLHLYKKYARKKILTNIYGGKNGRKEKESNTTRISSMFY